MSGPAGVTLPGRAAWALGVAVAAALAAPGWPLAALAVVAAGSFVAAGRARVLLRLAPALALLALFACAINAVVVAGTPLWPGARWSPSVEGARIGLTAAARLAVTGLAFAWLASTTAAGAALDTLRGGVLVRLGAPGERLGLVALVALRFGPLVAEEGRRLLRAVALRTGRRPGLWAAPAVAVPLVLTAVRRADRLAYVLEARHFGQARRTPPRPRPAGWRDAALAVLAVALAAGAALARS